MEMYVRYNTLPEGTTLDKLKLELAELLEEDGWLTGSAEGPEGGYVELELEDELVNPKHGIVAVKRYLQEHGYPRETQIELAGVPVGIYE